MSDTGKNEPADEVPLERQVRRRGKEYATLTRMRPEIRFGQFVKGTLVPELVCEVEVMARAKGYAMVRRNGCLPFVASERDLTSNVLLSGCTHSARTVL